MYRTGALVVDSGRLLLPALATAARMVTGVLYIPLPQCVSTVEGQNVASDQTAKTTEGHRYLFEATQCVKRVYFQISKLSPLLEVRILLPQLNPSLRPSPPPLQHSIDVLLSPFSTFQDIRKSAGYQMLAEREKSNLESKFQKIEVDSVPEVDSCTSKDRSVMHSYSDTALGGTFDSLHNGHRLLLTQSSLITNRRILVGVADGPLLASKILPELIQPIEARISEVKRFLSDVKPWIEHDVVAITDVYGPTAWDASMECLVVSPDTARGGEKVNQERRRKGLTPLVVHTIDLVGSDEEEPSPEHKLSSSDIRRNMLGSYKKIEGSHCLPEHNPSQGPYLIGLTGGIACGKSSIFSRLIEMGAFPIDCDKLGHKAYMPGMIAYGKIVEEFGEGILSETGEINRKVLGPIVFSDKAKLQRLNEIVWPEIWRLAEEKIHQAHAEGYKVCVIDAAVLLKAGWDRYIHEVWVTIAPEKEVVNRIIKRDNLTEEAAKKRMAAQMSNAEYVSHANVIFSTQWEPDYTQSQVARAWRELQERIS